MSSPDPTNPGGVLPPDATLPTLPTPPKQPGPVNPLNPALLSNVSVIGSFVLALAGLVAMCILAIIYDGAYAAALSQLAQTLVYAGMGVGGATTLAHSLRRSQ